MARILIVDDDELWSPMLAKRLRREGQQADFVLTAEEALESLNAASEPFEILLIDHRLGPGMDGIELLHQVRTQYPAIDAVLFTGLDEPGVGLSAYQAGAYRYLHKPFEAQELILIIQSLLDWRATRYERDWLSVLNGVVEELQRANTVAEAGRVLVAGGIRLGFDRARFYQVRDVGGTPSLFGICQSGVNQVVGFETIVRSMPQTKYSKVAYEQRAPVFFDSRELGRSFLSEYSTQDGASDSLGEWASIPLFSAESCVGILNLDNAARKGTIHPQQKELLRLFAGQAVSALERALRYEEAQQERQIENLARKIIQQMGNPAEKDALDRLLSAIRENFLGREKDDNFIVALQDKETGWYRYRLHIENGVPFPPSWRAPTQGGLIKYVMGEKSPLFLASDAAAFREANGIAQVGLNPARSWMGVPLRIGEEVIGAVVMENDYKDYAFTEEQFHSFKHLAGHLTSVIQAAWLNEQEREYSKLLHQLQEASELIPGFDEEKLWWTTLTLCTADYGASFDRAMLFLAEEGGTRLRGRMAVGHLTKKEAEADWEEYVRIGMNWERFLADLQAGTLKPTPLDGAVRNWTFAVSQGDAFSEVLSSNKFLSVSKEDAQKRLPADFLARFDVTHYCLVPVKAGEQMVGVVVLDNIWEKDPNRLGVLEILDNLTNQAALLAENLHKSKALEDLIALQHDVLVQSSVRPLQETLQRICDAAKTIAGADLAAIYPLQDNGEELRYDHRYSARVGRRNLPDSAVSHTPTGLSRYALLEAKEPVFIEDVMADTTPPYGGERHGDAAIVKDEGIRATIAVPVFGRRTGAARAMFYIDYHTPRTFNEHDRRIAEAFAHLIATAIRNWRDAQGLRDAQEAQDKELSRLSEVLQSALAAESDERQIAQLLLEKIPELFAPLPVTMGITLREWQRSSSDDEPTEIYRFIYPAKSGLADRLIHLDDKIGINGRAIQTGILQNVADVSKDDVYQPRYQGYEGTQSELDVPIRVDGQVVGALNIESSELAAFTKHHEEMGQRFADIAALAIGNTRRQRNLRTVLDAARAITAPSDLPNTLRQITDSIRQAVPSLSTLTIWYKDPQTGELTLANSYFGVHNRIALLKDRPRKMGMVRTAMKQRKPIWVEDITRNKTLAKKNFVKAEGIHSTVVFPLWSQDQAVGVMFFSYREPHTFTDEEKRLYPILAEVVAASIRDALLLEEAHNKRQQAEKEGKRFQLALDITEVVGTELDLEKMITRILTHLQSNALFPNTTPAILLYNKDDNTLEFTPSSLQFYKPDNPAYVDLTSIPVNEHSIAGAAALESQLKKAKKLTNIPNVHSHPNYLRVRLKTQSQISVTLYSNERGLIGVLVLESDQLDAFDRDAEQLAWHCAKQVRLAVERAQQREDLEFNETLAAASAWSREIAHDISQEILEIRYWADALRYKSGNSGTEQSVQKIDEAAQRLTGVSLPERQKPQEITLNDVLSRHLVRIIQEQDNSIHLDLDGLQYESFPIETYPFAIERIFRHLVRNSRQAMERSKQTNKRISVAIHLIKEDEVEIEYTDNGPGFPSSLRSKVFRTRLPSEQDPQRGVGLLLVRFIVEQIGGSIRLAPDRSAEETGVCFQIRLPRKQPSQHEEGIP